MDNERRDGCKKTGKVHEVRKWKLILRVPLQKEAKIHSANPSFSVQDEALSLDTKHFLRHGKIIKDIWLFSGIPEGDIAHKKKIDKSPRGAG